MTRYTLRARALLNYSLNRHPFPALNQVAGLRILVEDAALSYARKGTDDKDLSRCLRWTPRKSAAIYRYLLDINDLQEQLNAPLHVTGMDVGVPAALYWLRERQFGTGLRDKGDWALGDPPTAEEMRIKEQWDHRDRESRRIARRALAASRESYTLGRGFRESISSLYYLYDDFNDRRLHLNQALQMSGMELGIVLERLLRQT